MKGEVLAKLLRTRGGVNFGTLRGQYFMRTVHLPAVISANYQKILMYVRFPTTDHPAHPGSGRGGSLVGRERTGCLNAPTASTDPH